MNDQPGDALDEAAKLFDALMRRIGGGGGGGGGAGRDRDTDQDGDAWSRATAEQPTIATGAPECRDCPICRAIAMRRAAGGDIGRHLRDAGHSLLGAAMDIVAAFDRAASDQTGSGRSRPDRTCQDRRPEASERPPAGRSERSDRRGKGEPWSAATGGGPIDIG